MRGDALFQGLGFLLLLGFGGLRLAAQAAASAGDPCPNARHVPDQLKAPRPIPPGENFEFEKRLLAYFKTGAYRKLGWCEDKAVRDTGDWVNSVYYGTHPAVRIYYSPEVMTWLRNGRQGKIADGAVILKEQYPPPAIRYSGLDDGALQPSDWTFMIKNAAASKDGWFWGEVWGTMSFDNRLQYPNAGYGLYCIRCHASAESEYTFSASTNIKGFPGEPIQFRVDDTWRTVAQGVPGPSPAPKPPAFDLTMHEKNEFLHLAEAAAPKVPTLAASTQEFRTMFSVAPRIEEQAPVPFPAASYDHYVSAATGPNLFLTSDQCQVCHSASPVGNYGPNMYLGQGNGLTLNLNGNSLQSAGPQTINLNVSPYGEWRWSPMGLAGRDPVFFSQLDSELAYIKSIPDPQVSAALQQQAINTCMLCHGAMGKRTYDQDHNCKDSLNCPGFSPDFVFESYQQDPKNFQYGALSRDGISCTTCHHIVEDRQYGKPDGLNYFLEHSINGQYETGKPEQLFGPFDDVATYPMDNALGIKPHDSAYLKSSRMCGSCHTINLPVIDKTPPPIHPIDGSSVFSIEQATYLEWVNSEFQDEFKPVSASSKSCQDCHMPNGYANRIHNFSVPQIQGKIAVIEDNSFPQADYRAAAEKLDVKFRTTGYGRHELVGINAFLLEMMNQFSWVMGLWTSDYMSGSLNDLPNAIDNMVQQAQTATAKVDVNSSVSGGMLTAEVQVANRTGHRFPSGVGFRRAFLEFLVLEKQGDQEKLLWSSGRTNEDGEIVGPDAKPLPSESFQVGPDGKQQYQEHHNQEFPINRQDEVQIYEELVQDAQGKFTTSFLRRDVEFKDNRLLPSGWTKDGPDPSLKHFFLESTYPKGRAATDQVYLSGKGVSIVKYQVKLPAGIDPKNVRVQATLYYQSLPPYFLNERFRTPGSNSQRLEYLAGHLDLDGTPLQDWKLKIVSVSAPANGSSDGIVHLANLNE
jgi:hypothetical protein